MVKVPPPESWAACIVVSVSFYAFKYCFCLQDAALTTSDPNTSHTPPGLSITTVKHVLLEKVGHHTRPVAMPRIWNAV